MDGCVVCLEMAMEGLVVVCLGESFGLTDSRPLYQFSLLCRSLTFLIVEVVCGPACYWCGGCAMAKLPACGLAPFRIRITGLSVVRGRW